MKYGERIAKARKHAKLTQGGLANAVKNLLTQQAISHLENSDATGSEYTVQIALACGVRSEWLAMEVGDMIGNHTLATQPPATYQVKDPIQDALSALDKLEADAYLTRLKTLKSQIEETEANIRLAAKKARNQEKSAHQSASTGTDDRNPQR